MNILPAHLITGSPMPQGSPSGHHPAACLRAHHLWHIRPGEQFEWLACCRELILGGPSAPIDPVITHQEKQAWL